MNIGTVVAGIMIIGLIICFAVSSKKSGNCSTGNYHSGSGIFRNWSEKRRIKREEKERRRENKMRLKEEKRRQKAENYRMKEERRYNRGNKMIGGYNGHDSYDSYDSEYSPHNSRYDSRYNSRHRNDRYSHQPRYNDEGYDENGNFRFRDGTSPSYHNSNDMYVPTLGDRIKDTVGAVTSGAKSVKNRVKATKETAEYTGEKLSDLKESTIESALGVYDKSVHYMKKGKDMTEEAWDKSEKFRNATGRVFKRTANAAVKEFKETAKNIKDMKARDREKESKKQSNKDKQEQPDSEPSNRKDETIKSMEEFEEE